MSSKIVLARLLASTSTYRETTIIGLRIAFPNHGNKYLLLVEENTNSKFVTFYRRLLIKQGKFTLNFYTMKPVLISLGIAVAIFFMGCNENDGTNGSLNLDIQKYESELSVDYTNAQKYHNDFTADSLYNGMMFHQCDSLFSDHFYDFCIDMMQNSGMMSDGNGMMGGKGGMMGGSGGMMGGNPMGSLADKNNMLDYMDSVHVVTHGMNPDFLANDSLMYRQMTLCQMMVTQTDGIETLYDNMQLLREAHKKMHLTH